MPDGLARIFILHLWIISKLLPDCMALREHQNENKMLNQRTLLKFELHYVPFHNIIEFVADMCPGIPPPTVQQPVPPPPHPAPVIPPQITTGKL